MTGGPEHGPTAGCNWRRCGVLNAERCPFTKGGATVSDIIAPPPFAEFCRHEWRQLQVTMSTAPAKPDFYCVHCLATCQLP